MPTDDWAVVLVNLYGASANAICWIDHQGLFNITMKYALRNITCKQARQHIMHSIMHEYKHFNSDKITIFVQSLLI